MERSGITQRARQHIRAIALRSLLNSHGSPFVNISVHDFGTSQKPIREIIALLTRHMS